MWPIPRQGLRKNKIVFKIAVVKVLTCMHECDCVALLENGHLELVYLFKSI